MTKSAFVYQNGELIDDEKKSIALIVEELKMLSELVAQLMEAQKNQPDIQSIVSAIVEHKESCRQTEIIGGLSVCAVKIDKQNDAIIALANKMDAEDVTNLDKNYTSSIQTILN